MKEGTSHDWMADPLPEYVRYQDEGCELSNSCLNCPFPRCIYEVPGGLQRYRQDKKAREIVFQHGRGLSAKQIARLLGESLRSVQRVIREFKLRTQLELDENQREVWDE
ncbi:hypothetical protein [Dehalogenimonas sp. 4OHTPN]|uniref:Helix-turn-helix domain-containing protein n=1 Tax=Dehalogenimonas sp. 4OHTPN TaxID=3166643 RepID=A0AAU8GAE8_9CHLR